jgi:hypothetical protein
MTDSEPQTIEEMKAALSRVFSQVKDRDAFEHPYSGSGPPAGLILAEVIQAYAAILAEEREQKRAARIAAAAPAPGLVPRSW